MIEESVREEVSRQLEIWAGAYKNVDALNKSIAELDAQRAVLEEKCENESCIRDRAAVEISSLIEDIEDNEENRAQIEEILRGGMTEIMFMQVIG